MHKNRLVAATVLATVMGLMGSGVAVAANTAPAAKPAAKAAAPKADAKAAKPAAKKAIAKPMKAAAKKPVAKVAAKKAAKPMHHMAMNHKMGDMACSCWNANWKVDGIFGSQTNEGVREFQHMHGLNVDGIVGPQTQKALGLKLGSSPKLGAKGEDVRKVQEALKACWMGMNKKPAPKPKPTPKPTPMPTPMPTLAPTPMPTETPTPMPTETPTPAPTEEPQEEGVNRPTLELRGGDWMLPASPGGGPDWTFTKPTWTGSGSLWLGDWGIGGGLTMWNQFQMIPTASVVGPVYMYNGDLKWRSAAGHWTWNLGYRGLNTQNLNFGEIGAEWDQPLLSDWLWFQARATGGWNFSNAFFGDGLAGLELRLGPVGLDAGYRALYMNAPGGSNTWMAPQATIRLGF